MADEPEESEQSDDSASDDLPDGSAGSGSGRPAGEASDDSTDGAAGLLSFGSVLLKRHLVALRRGAQPVAAGQDHQSQAHTDAEDPSQQSAHRAA